MTNQLQFDENGFFSIMQLTDLHMGHDAYKDAKTLSLIQQIIAQERPDLIVYTGDIIGGQPVEAAIEALHQALSPAVTSHIPFAMVFGNHDTECVNPKMSLLDKQAHILEQQKYALCMTKSGPSDVDGIGNYVLPVYDRQGDVPWVLFFLDSGNQNPLPNIGGWDYIKSSQIDWVKKTVISLTGQFGFFHALLFLHIPLPEFAHAWQTETCYGEKNEAINGPYINSGLFTALLESDCFQGVFAGHQHLNDFHGSHHGITLAYGRCTGYGAYGKPGFPKGARIISLGDRASQFHTKLCLEDSLTIFRQPLHQKCDDQ